MSNLLIQIYQQKSLFSQLISELSDYKKDTVATSLKMGKHLEKIYSDVAEIGKCQQKRKHDILWGKTARNNILDKFRNLGDFSYNTDTLLKKRGVFYVGRRPLSNTPNHPLPQDYLPRQFCLVFCLGKELWRHLKKM